MRKGFLIVLAVVLVAAFAAPAMADLSTSGFVRIKERVEQNYRTGGLAALQGGGFVLPGKDVSTASYVEQRQRFILDWKSENAGARAYFEMDFGQWGDSAYTAARNQGAGLEGDSINLETKNFYAWFTVPNSSVTLTAGLQNQTDSFGGMIFGYADMAGVFVTGKAEPVQYKFGFAKFQEGNVLRDDDVDLYVAEVKFMPVKEAKLGLDFYMIRDASGSTPVASGSFGTNLTTLSRVHYDYWADNLVVTNFTYKPTNIYFIGVDGSFGAGPATLSGYAFYNFGKAELLGGTFAGDAVGPGTPDTEIKVKAFAVDLRAEMNAGPGKFFVEGAYVSGQGDGDKDWKAPITASNYAYAGSFPLTSMDMQILLPNIDDINNSAALAYDVQNKGRGIMAAAVGFRMKVSDALAAKVGAGYLADTKNTVGTNEAGVTIKKHKAFELNGNLNYTIVKGMDIGVYGAYAFLTDWENYGAQTVVPVNTTTIEDADNIYKAMFRMNYAF
ncbi:MAG TPA: hypothetical protein VN450_08020 [Candidatus Methylomirabilis sp.]|nr:hypothetical protein [Candidatus Methylomirabilis sp.]